MKREQLKIIKILSFGIACYFVSMFASCADDLNEKYSDSYSDLTDAIDLKNSDDTKGYANGTSWYPTSTPASAWESGSGTTNDPYLVVTAQQLANLAYFVNNGISFIGKYFKLSSDIDLNNGYSVYTVSDSYKTWTPIGNDKYAFSGKFDGNSHSIKGVYINNSMMYDGLFGKIVSATIKNLSVTNSYIKNNSQTYSSMDNYTGGIVGYADSSSAITNCTNKAIVIGNNNSGNYAYVGGIIGYSECELSSFTNSGTVSGKGYVSYIGGICGYTNRLLSSVINIGTVYSDGSTYAYTGGLSGKAVQIKNSSNTGSVLDSISTTESSIGGISGVSKGILSNIYNSGTVIGTGKTVKSGGLVGYLYSGNMYNCVNKGSITSNASTSGYTGGIAGFGSYTSCSIYNSYSLGSIDASGQIVYLGGIVGYSTNVSCYYDYYKIQQGVSRVMNNSNSYISSGIFSSASGSVTGWNNSTLTYTGKLLTILNDWVSAQSSSDYSSWISGNDGYPVLQ